MRLIIVRHGETDYNVLGLVNYEPTVDVYLTEKGRDQAERLARELKSEKIDVIFISKLGRTKQTAEILNQFHKVPIIEDERLDDICNGFEGKPVVDAKAWRNTQPDPATAKLSEEWESSRDVYDRVRDFLNDTAKLSYQTALIVTSSHLVKHFKAINEGRPATDVLREGSAMHAEFYEMEVGQREEK
jgi:probable phosphoglycerate mutase